jgi:hypothetical protein
MSSANPLIVFVVRHQLSVVPTPHLSVTEIFGNPFVLFGNNGPCRGSAPR